MLRSIIRRLQVRPSSLVQVVRPCPFCTPEMEKRLCMLGRFLYTWDRSALWRREVHDAKIDGCVHEVRTLVFLNRSTSPQSLP